MTRLMFSLAVLAVALVVAPAIAQTDLPPAPVVNQVVNQAVGVAGAAITLPVPPPEQTKPAAKAKSAAACLVCGPECPCGPGVNCGAANCPSRLPSLPAFGGPKFCGTGGCCGPATCGPNGCQAAYRQPNYGIAGCAGGGCNQPPVNYNSRRWLPQRPLLFRFRGRCRGCR